MGESSDFHDEFSSNRIALYFAPPALGAPDTDRAIVIVTISAIEEKATHPDSL